MNLSVWKVGELANATGLSIRTLHYYDEIGLLTPSQRTKSGHRLYTPEDVQRLLQVKSLRQLGFPLEEIRDMVHHDRYTPAKVVAMHIDRIREQIERQQKLCQRLEHVAAQLNSKQPENVELFLKTIKEIDMVEAYDTYYTPEQKAALADRQRTLGPDQIRNGEADWKELIEQLRTEMENGTDPTEDSVKTLARKWLSLIEAFTGGDKGIEQSLGKVWQGEPSLKANTGLDPQLWEYASKALAALKK